jgi:hypothetical protein
VVPALSRPGMPDPHDAVVRRLADACRAADAGALRATLAPDCAAVCDGGVLPAVQGADDVSELLLALFAVDASRRAGDVAGRLGDELTLESVNGRPGLALRKSGHPVAVVAVTAAGDRVTALWIVLNPAKLTGWHRPAR